MVLSPFAVSTSFVGDRVEVRVGGSIDRVTAPILRRLLERVADDGYDVVLVDLGAVDIVDAEGARSLASFAARKHRGGERLTVRAAPAQLREALELGALDPWITFTAGDPRPRSTPVDDGAGTVASELFLAHMGPRDRPYAVVDAALRLVTSLAQATVAGAEGVSVSLHRFGGLMTVAASDERIVQMDHDQYATGQGPCLAAAATGRAVQMPALATDHRWPAFTARARMAGIASILSSPVLSEGGPVGALNMYSRTAGAFGRRERELAELFAEQASGILAEAAPDPLRKELGDRLRAALEDREVIAHAQGVLMGRTGCSPREAYSTLRLAARREETTVRHEAESVLGSVEGDDRRSPRPTDG